MSRDRSGDRPKTAAELMAELRRDPHFATREDQMGKRRREHAQLYANAAEPVLEELQNAGFSVRAVRELRALGADSQAAIPILIRWLPLVSYQPLKEDIVRTLSVPWAKPVAARPLLEEFKRLSEIEDAGFRWTIASALEVVADKGVLDDLIQLVQDPTQGKAREMLAMALAQIADARVVAVLRDLLEDEAVVGHAIMALGKLRARAALSELERLQKHPKEWVRQEAKKAVARMNRPE